MYTNGIIQYVLLLVWLSLGMFVSRFAHFDVCVSSSFLFMPSNNHWMGISGLFLHSADNSHVHCFHFLTITNKVAVNILIQVFYGLMLSFLLGDYLGVWQEYV